MRPIDADSLTEFLKCLLPERGMWEIEGDTVKNAVCETVAEAIEMVKNMETIQPEKAQLSQEGTTKDTISRQAAIDAAKDWYEGLICGSVNGLIKRLNALPTIQTEPAIPLSWIEKYIEWLKSFDNEFANLAAAHISVMVKKWRDEQNEQH